MAFLRAPLQEVLLAGVGFDLVAHAAQQVGRGLRGHDEGADHGGRDLPQDPAHRPGEALLLVAPRRHLAQGLRRIDHPLGEERGGGEERGREGERGEREREKERVRERERDRERVRERELDRDRERA